MKSFTLHNLDEQLASLIKHRADELSISMNQLAKRILAEGLGIQTPVKPPHQDEFACFCGTWSESEAREFDQRTADMKTTDAEDWQ